MTTTTQGQLAHINIFTPRPGMIDEFVATQLKGLPALGDIPGLLGSRLYRATDDRNLIAVALFESEEAHRRFMETPAFKQHRQHLLPLLEGTSPGYYTLIYARDNVQDGEPDSLPAASPLEYTAGR
jgi:heme-degrading monooxygenase HmoA